MVVSLRDETARKEMDDALREQSAMLRAQVELLDLAHDAIFVRDVSTGMILSWNHGAEEVYGYGRDEAVGKVSHELLQTEFPQPLSAIEATLGRDGRWEGELVQRRQDGRAVTIESWGRSIAPWPRSPWPSIFPRCCRTSWTVPGSCTMRPPSP